MELTKLRQQHPKFIYRSFTHNLNQDNLEISFEFLIEPDITFNPKLEIGGISPERFSALSSSTLDNLVFNLGLIELFSYWKTTCSPQIMVEAGPLSEEQTKWWHDILINGMAEFFYTNQIDFTGDDFVKFIASNTTNPAPNPSHQTNSNDTAPVPYLVPVGGGKDSALTLGILDKHQRKYSCLLLSPLSPSAEEVVETSQAQDVIRVKRTLDPKLLELNQAGYLNGHTPFSAYLAFLSMTTAYIFDHPLVILSNERSANEGNLTFYNQVINHQYSKSFDFEKKFREYSQRFLFTNQQNTLSPQYLSWLRPIYELQIARLFADYPQYHSIFHSCNHEQQNNVWCHNCPKCLFVFVSLFPFVDTTQLTTQIFNHNLLENEDLLPEIRKLLKQDDKPLECVGTYEETLIAFHLSVKKYHQQDLPLPRMLEVINQEALKNETNLDERAQELLKSWNDQHFLPSDLEQIIRQEIANIK